MLTNDLNDIHAKQKASSQAEIIQFPIEHQKPTRARKEYDPDAYATAPHTDTNQSLKSYDEFNAVQNYFLSRHEIRNWAMWVIGVATGLRISDIVKLKVKYFLKEDFTFRERVYIQEKKTRKFNNIIITEAVKIALTKLFHVMNGRFELDDYIFRSQKGLRLETRSAWRIISNAGKAVDPPIEINTRTMRKTFLTVAVCLFESTIDPAAFTTGQMLYKHSSIQTTMRYLGIMSQNEDAARMSVSDFVLGKTEMNEIKMRANISMEVLLDRLDKLENNLRGNNEIKE